MAKKKEVEKSVRKPDSIGSLKAETEKWLGRIKVEVTMIEPKGKKQEEYMRNILAYISDCEYFQKKDKNILAFEAVVWAWAWISILREVGIFPEQESL